MHFIWVNSARNTALWGPKHSLSCDIKDVRSLGIMHPAAESSHRDVVTKVYSDA